MNMEYYGRLLPYAEKFGVKIGIENMWQKHSLRKNIVIDTCGTIDEFIRYIDTLNSEYAVACLDVGHALLPNNMHGTVGDFIRALGRDRLKALHIHDNDYINDLHRLPYLGKLDWNDITKALGEIDYTGDFTYEVADALFANAPENITAAAINFWGAVGRDLVRKVEENRPKK
jgi:sugar phosphate isomerase/epimerase